MEPQRAVVGDVNFVFDIFLRNRLVTAVTGPIGAFTHIGLARAVNRAGQSASADFCQDDLGDILSHRPPPRAAFYAAHSGCK